MAKLLSRIVALFLVLSLLIDPFKASMGSRGPRHDHAWKSEIAGISLGMGSRDGGLPREFLITSEALASRDLIAMQPGGGHTKIAPRINVQAQRAVEKITPLFMRPTPLIFAATFLAAALLVDFGILVASNGDWPSDRFFFALLPGSLITGYGVGLFRVFWRKRSTRDTGAMPPASKPENAADRSRKPLGGGTPQPAEEAKYSLLHHLLAPYIADEETRREQAGRLMSSREKSAWEILVDSKLPPNVRDEAFEVLFPNADPGSAQAVEAINVLARFKRGGARPWIGINDLLREYQLPLTPTNRVKLSRRLNDFVAKARLVFMGGQIAGAVKEYHRQPTSSEMIQLTAYAEHIGALDPAPELAYPIPAFEPVSVDRLIDLTIAVKNLSAQPWALGDLFRLEGNESMAAAVDRMDILVRVISLANKTRPTFVKGHIDEVAWPRRSSVEHFRYFSERWAQEQRSLGELNLIDVRKDLARIAYALKLPVDILISGFGKPVGQPIRLANGLANRKVGVLFPSAAGISPSMPVDANALYHKYSVVKTLYDQAATFSGRSVQSLMLSTRGAINPINILLATLLYSTTLYRALEAELSRPLHPLLLAGQSIGTLAAMVIGDAISLEEAIGCILGVDRLAGAAGDIPKYRVLTMEGGQGQELRPFLIPGEIELLQDASPAYLTLALGERVDADNLIARIRAAVGPQTKITYDAATMDTPGWHTSYVEFLRDALQAKGARLNLSASKIPLVSSSRPGLLIETADELRAELSGFLFAPVHWSKAVAHVLASGVQLFVEIGGNRLTGWNKRLAPSVDALIVHDIASLKHAA